MVGLANELPEDATEEQIRSIDAELEIIASEDSRRDALVNLRNHQAAQVIAGAGTILGASDDDAGAEPHIVRAASLGDRVLAQMQERGFGHQGERFNLSNISFRAEGDTPATTTPTIGPNLNPALSTDFGADTLDDVSTDIRIGYRQPMTIEQLFGSEVTEKDAVSFYVEGDVTGAPAMTAEAGEYSQLEFGKPTKKTSSIKKITAFWKNSDELMSDSPRLVSHINARAPYLMDLAKEQQLLSGSGTGENITGLLSTSGIGTGTVTGGVSMTLVDSLLDWRSDIQKATPNFDVDALVVSDDDYAALLKLKDSNNQYVLGGPVNRIYGQAAAITPVLWNTIKVVPTPALTKGTMILGAFKRGATVINHASGRRFEMNYDGDDFTHGLITFRTSERFTLAVEYPAAFKKLTVSSS